MVRSYHDKCNKWCSENEYEVFEKHLHTEALQKLDTALNATQSTGAVEYIDCISVQGEYPLPNDCPRYKSKSSDDDAQVMDIWGMQSIPSFLLLLGPLWHEVIEPNTVLPVGQTK